MDIMDKIDTPGDGFPKKVYMCPVCHELIFLSVSLGEDKINAELDRHVVEACKRTIRPPSH